MDSITYVKANGSPSQPGVGKADYLPWVVFEDNGHIVTASCTCTVGLGRTCNFTCMDAWLSWIDMY